ncbi:MAG: FkbM family methyltransferase, partial [Verrucomicrobiaceae bacterium]
MRAPIYIGSNRAITFLPEGHPVVVDTRSMDSINLLLGWSIEQDVLPIFRKLLTNTSVFIDVGANFGVYTAIALSRLRKGGGVFSFEANPHTYELLKWTIYANFGLEQPNVRYFNLAVSDSVGEKMILYSMPNTLGGASLHAQPAGSEPSEVTTTTLDSVIPDNIVPDIIKIDVEGHEPFVMRGCQRILAQSPNVVFIIELFEATLWHYGRNRFVDELRNDYRLKIFVTGPGSTLTPLPDGEYPGTECYILATRRTLEGLADADYCIHRDDLSFLEEGPIFYGPYAHIRSGQYQAHVRGGPIGEVTLRIQGDYGREIYGEEHLIAGQESFSFVIPYDTNTLEIVALGKDRNPRFDRIRAMVFPRFIRRSK